MYRRGRNQNVSPFEVRCTNCGSHDVNVHAVKNRDLEVRCNKCGSYLNTEHYNELECENDKDYGFLMVMVVVIIFIIFGM